MTARENRNLWIALGAVIVSVVLLAFVIESLIANSHSETLTEQAAPVFNVTGYGATPNDGGSDQVAIQNAINAACPVRGSVYIPTGRWRVISLKLCDGITVYGDGAGQTILEAQDNAMRETQWPQLWDHVFVGRNAQDAGYTRDVTIYDLSIDGRWQWQHNGNGTGALPAMGGSPMQFLISASGAIGWHVYNFEGYNAYGDCLYVGEQAGREVIAESNHFHDFHCHDVLRNGVSITAGRNNLFERFRVENNQQGLNPQNALYRQNRAEAERLFRAAEFDLEPSGLRQVASYNIIRDGVIRAPFEHALGLTRPNVQIRGNRFERITFELCARHCIAIFVDDAEENVFINMSFPENVGLAPVSILRGDRNCVLNSTFRSSGGPSVTLNGRDAGNPAVDNVIANNLWLANEEIQVVQSEPVLLLGNTGSVSINGPRTTLTALPDYCQVEASPPATSTVIPSVPPATATVTPTVTPSVIPTALPSATLVPGSYFFDGQNWWLLAAATEVPR